MHCVFVSGCVFSYANRNQQRCKLGLKKWVLMVNSAVIYPGSVNLLQMIALNLKHFQCSCKRNASEDFFSWGSEKLIKTVNNENKLFSNYENHKAKANVILIIAFSVNFSSFIPDNQINLYSFSLNFFIVLN